MFNRENSYICQSISKRNVMLSLTFKSTGEIENNNKKDKWKKISCIFILITFKGTGDKMMTR